MRYDLALTKCMLRGRRMKSAPLPVRYGRAVAQSPDAWPSLKFERLSDKQTTVFLWTRNRFEQRIRGRSGSPNECVRVNRGPVTQLHSPARKLLHFCIQANFHFALRELSLSVSA